jgi:hypothetical protein
MLHMTDHVESGEGSELWAAVVGVIWIDDAQHRTQGSVSNTSLCHCWKVVENAHSYCETTVKEEDNI